MTQLSTILRLRPNLALTAVLTGFLTAGLSPSGAATAPALVDDFSAADHTSGGGTRFVATDKDIGSSSHATSTCADGRLTVKGELVPGRGVPAFISVVLFVTPDATPVDASGYEGVRIRVKSIKGGLSVQVATSDITNFDYHSAPVEVKAGDFHEVRIPFKDMKRAWSEQTTLNSKSVTSVNLVSFATTRDTFAYEVDEVGFY